MSNDTTPAHPHISLGGFTIADVTEQIRSSAKRFRALLDLVGDERASGPKNPVWSAGDIARHVTFLPGYYESILDTSANLAPSAVDMAAVNETNMAALNDLSMTQCAEQFTADMASLVDRLAVAPLDAAVAFQAGTEATPVQLGGICLGELEIHGFDLAQAVGAPWTIDERAAAMAVMAAIPAAGSAWLDTNRSTDHTASYEIRFRRSLGVVRIEFNDGVMEAAAYPAVRTRRADTIVGANAAAMLAVFYGRSNQWGAIARGQMLSWGRKPWNALTLKGRFLPI